MWYRVLQTGGVTVRGTVLVLAVTGSLVPASLGGAVPRDGFSSQEARVDTVGGRPLVTTVLPDRRPDAEEWRLVEDFRLGSVGGGEQEAFADVHDLAVDDAGRLYVLDVGAKEVRVFDAGGHYLRSIAPDGDGPGELRYRRAANQQITWQLPGRLWIGDGLQQVTFDTLGTELGRAAGERRYFVAGELPKYAKVVAADTLGAVFVVVDVIAIRSFGQNVVPRHTSVARLPVSAEFELLPGDTLAIETRNMTSGASPTTAGTGTGQVTIQRVHDNSTPRFAWSVERDGTLWLADRSGYRFDKLTFTGDTVRTVQIGEVQPPPADDAAFVPVLSALTVSPEGWLWVRREAAEVDGGSTWDVLDNCGRYRAALTAPVRLRAVELGAGGVVYGVASDALDVNYVYRYRLDGPSPAPVARETCPF